MSAVKDDSCDVVSVPFTISSLAALLASEIGFACATGFNHPGKKLIGNIAVLVNATGKKRKFTTAKKLSVLFAAIEIPVKSVEKTVVSIMIAKNTPRRFATLKPAATRSPSGKSSATTKVITAATIAFTMF